MSLNSSIKNFKSKKIAVLGAGVEGISSAKFLLGKGADVTILDKREVGEVREIRGIRVIGGENYLENLGEYDLIVRSPGVKRDLPEIVQVEKKGVLITSQTKIFFDLCPCPIIGVTGTKGKGTTSSLIYEMLKKEGKDVYLGGNIGSPPLDFLDKLNPQSIVVLELSSFQLQDVDKSPHIAVVLMIVPEHLNYHKDMEEYVLAKRNMLKFQTSSDFTVLNKDYSASRESDIYTDAKVYYISREGEVEEGCFMKNEKIILRIDVGSLTHIARPAHYAQENSQSNTRSLNERRLQTDTLLEEKSESSFSCLANGQASSFKKLAFSSSVGGQAPSAETEEEIVEIKEILLPGKHNLENVCAAVMAATLAGVSKKAIVNVLKTFKGLEHRLELVGEVRGVKYYDDSFSTTPETAIAAIQAFKNPEILILGGSSKNSDFSELGKVISEAKNIKAIIGIGEEWKRIKTQFKVQSSKFKVIEGCRNMREIVQKASEIAEPGDVVILSPACASFDMFKNYKERGEKFKEEVKCLIQNAKFKV